jgi:hypothetical protein
MSRTLVALAFAFLALSGCNSSGGGYDHRGWGGGGAGYHVANHEQGGWYRQ